MRLNIKSFQHLDDERLQQKLQPGKKEVPKNNYIIWFGLWKMRRKLWFLPNRRRRSIYWLSTRCLAERLWIYRRWWGTAIDFNRLRTTSMLFISLLRTRSAFAWRTSGRRRFYCRRHLSTWWNHKYNKDKQPAWNKTRKYEAKSYLWSKKAAAPRSEVSAARRETWLEKAVWKSTSSQMAKRWARVPTPEAYLYNPSKRPNAVGTKPHKRDSRTAVSTKTRRFTKNNKNKNN